MEKQKAKIQYRVKFLYKDEPKPLEVIVGHVEASEFLGLLCLEGFIFTDQTKHVILPSEDDARKRFANTNRLHIPYHNVVYIEEFTEQSPDLKNLPFIKEVEQPDPSG